VELAEAEWRSASIETYRDQSLRVAAFGRLVLDPRRFDRILGPQHDDDLRVFERLVDLVAEPRTPVEMPVPPNFVARATDRIRQPFG